MDFKNNISTTPEQSRRLLALGVKPETEWLDYPSVDDGVTGLQFIEAVVRSSTENAAWIKHPFEN